MKPAPPALNATHPL